MFRPHPIALKLAGLSLFLLIQACLATAQNGGLSGDAELRTHLSHVKRIFMGDFGQDAASQSLRSMLEAALTATGRFVVTENRERADAILKGTAISRVLTEFHSSSESTSVGSASGGGHSDRAGSASGFSALGMSTDDSHASTEAVEFASASARLVSTDGDTLWAFTAESRGAKFKGALSDAADRLVRQLQRDMERLDREKNLVLPSSPANR